MTRVSRKDDSRDHLNHDDESLVIRVLQVAVKVLHPGSRERVEVRLSVRFWTT